MMAGLQQPAVADQAEVFQDLLRRQTMDLMQDKMDEERELKENLEDQIKLDEKADEDKKLRRLEKSTKKVLE